MIFKNVLQKVGDKVIDYLIGDDPYELPDGRDSVLALEDKAKKNKDSMNETCCNKCKYCLKVLAPTNPPTWNIKCSHPIGDIIIPSGRIIKFRANRDDIVARPCWCPLLPYEEKENLMTVPKTETEVNAPEEKNGLKRPKRWTGVTKPNSWDIETKLNKFKPRLTLEDIKEGDIIHIPPTPADGRMDVLIKHKYVYSASGTVIGNENKTVYIYSSGLNSSIMSKRKKEDTV